MRFIPCKTRELTTHLSKITHALWVSVRALIHPLTRVNRKLPVDTGNRLAAPSGFTKEIVDGVGILAKLRKCRYPVQRSTQGRSSVKMGVGGLVP